jgi:hypothetical protein
MGRPLNKKYFGNRNTGSSSTTSDNGIGGGALASVSAGTVGSFVVSDTYQNFPTLTVALPTLPGGVRSVLTPVYELDTVTFSSGGQTDADYLAGLSTSIPSLGGGAVVNIVEVGSKVTAVNLTGGDRGEFRRGDFIGTGLTTHQVLQAPNAGTDLQIDVTFRVKRIEVTEAGSGYVGTPSLTWGGHTFTGQTAPSAQSVTMLTDSGSAGATTNQENAIVIRANVTDAGNKVGDIIKQVSTRRYKVRTADGTGIVELIQGDSTPNVGKAMIIATDSTGSTYWVYKLTSRKAVVYQKEVNGSFEFTDGQSVKWTYNAPTLNSTVQLENA